MMTEEMLIESDDNNFLSDVDDSDFEMESLSARIQKKKSVSKVTIKKAATKKTTPMNQESIKDIEMENLEPKKLNSKAPSKKKVGGTTAKKPSVKKLPLAEESSNKEEVEDDDFLPENTFSSYAKVSEDKKTVEERYQKKTQLEHILLRPDTYSEFRKDKCSFCEPNVTSL
jgi:hypothetical protein